MLAQIKTFLLPEIFIASMASIILLFDVFAGIRGKSIAYGLTLSTLVIAAIICYKNMPNFLSIGFSGSFIADKIGSTLKILIFLFMAIIFIYSRSYMIARDLFRGEFFALILLSILGMMFLVSSSSFLTMYLGLELFVLPIYALIVIGKYKAGHIESAMKYFIIGSLGAGLLLYGVSLLYGATGSLSLIATTVRHDTLMNLGMVFVLVGLAIELGAVPFHMWMPDVYEGSHTTVTMIIGTLPKIAVFGMGYRLFTIAFPAISIKWQPLLTILAIASLGFGNIVAISQTNIKRMLAYSTIGHVGFLMLGFLVGPTAGYTPALFYALIYALMALAAFGIIIQLCNSGLEIESIYDFRGLSHTSPWYAFLMLLTMFSLAGVPPMVGFYAKFVIIKELIAAGYLWLAIAAMIFSVIAAFYYLNIVRLMYFEGKDTPYAALPKCNGIPITGRVVLSLNSVSLLILGLFPGPIWFMCISAMQ